MAKEINILHMYPKILATYGDGGNIEALMYQGDKIGYKVNLYTLEIGENINNWDDIDIIFIGGGQDAAQLAVSRDIQRHGEAIVRHYNTDRIIFTICGGYQLLGEYFVTGSGERIQGLSIIPIKTVAGNYRAIGHSAIRLNNRIFNDIGEDNIVVGFENHSGMTMIGELEPLGAITNSAKGNNGKDGHEGVVSKNLFGTYLHGPILALNPHFRDLILQKAVLNKSGVIIDNFSKNKFETSAFKEVLAMI